MRNGERAANWSQNLPKINNQRGCRTKPAPAYTSDCIHCSLMMQTPSVPSGGSFHLPFPKRNLSRKYQTCCPSKKKIKLPSQAHHFYDGMGNCSLPKAEPCAGWMAFCVRSPVPHGRPGQGSPTNAGGWSCREHVSIHKHAKFDDI